MRPAGVEARQAARARLRIGRTRRRGLGREGPRDREPRGRAGRRDLGAARSPSARADRRWPPLEGVRLGSSAGRAAPAREGLPPLLPARPGARGRLRPGPARRRGRGRRRRGRPRHGGSSECRAERRSPPPERPPRPGPRPSRQDCALGPRSASPPPGGGARTLAARQAAQTRPVGDFLRTRAPRPKRKMQTFLKREESWLLAEREENSKTEFQAFAELLQVGGTGARPHPEDPRPEPQVQPRGRGLFPEVRAKREETVRGDPESE